MRFAAFPTVAMGLVALVGCTTSAGAPDPSSATASVSSEVATETASPSPTVLPQPEPPATLGRARGEMLFAQRAEDASLVSGDRPIRLTMARTGNEVAWFTAPPQRLSGVMTTEQMMLSLGWRPSDDGTTATLPSPRPNGMLSFADGNLALTVQQASVRADGTLVLDVNPIGTIPETVASFGLSTLSLDGVPGVVVIDDSITTDVSTRVIITGNRNQQAVVQILESATGEIIESRFVARDRPTFADMGDVVSGETAVTDIVVDFQPPSRKQDGRVTLSATVDDGGQVTQVSAVVGRWTLPADAEQ